MSQAYQHWILETDSENILWLGLNRADSKVNSLNQEVLIELEEIIDHVPSVKAVILYSGKKTGFIVGADISQFTHLHSASEATDFILKGQAIFNKLEKLAMPTIALIEGFCLGGGLELALACRYRIAENSSKTRLGFPEVKLGIHPGWGGTVRTPQKIGVLAAMDLILSGRMITAKAAKKIGLIDESVPLRLLKQVAKEYAQRTVKPSEKKSLVHYGHAFLEMRAMRPLVGQLLYKQLQKKIRVKHYPAPFAVVDNWVKYGSYDPNAQKIEAESIGNLIVTDTAKNLVRVFFLSEQLKGLGKKSKAQIQHVHVIGAGVMGGDIAAWCALRGLKVTLQDQAAALIGKAIGRAHQLAVKQLKEKCVIQEMMDRLMPDPEGLGIAHADIIIEAVTEKLQVKQDIFAQIELEAKPDAVLATNTSTIPLEEIQVALKNPQRLIGIHFFNPVAKMPLVEIVRSENTLPEYVDIALAFVTKISKFPLPVKSAPGFLVNRILLPYMLEAMLLLEEGVPAKIIDKAAEDFGMPMGPIELADTVGLDICLAALEKLELVQENKILSTLKEYVARGELGRKTGKGFYAYKRNVAIKPKLPQENIPQDITYRMILRILNEAVACLRTHIVDSADKLDAGCIFGFGFAPFTGGPLHYARAQGKDKIAKLFKEFEGRYGTRFMQDAGWDKVYD